MSTGYLHARIRALVDAAPPGTLVPVEALAGLLEEEGPKEELPGGDLVVADLTVEEVAAELDRAPSTVRGWIGGGLIPEAYRLRGREWRIPRPALRAFFDRKGQKPGDAPRAPAPSDPAAVDLGGWREHYRRAGGAG